jgi:putative nucleotidyltransferase with HDIG domain
MMRDVRKRSQIYRAGLVVGATTFLIELLLAFRVAYAGAAVSRVFLLLFVHAMADGLILAIAISALLPLFEFVFGLVTDITLLELTDLNHPVLRQLQMEAPGTYHHCISLAILVEQAAEAIGANALLARVCAYFHDIGKLAKPAYFTENNRGENPHDDLNPRMSSLVILNHVKEGMDLARQYKLKKPIREAIEQHHGTTLVSYFYEKAKTPGEETPEADYRYPGPRPIRREIAILSIADCCEAAARSLSRPTPQRIEALIDQLVFARVRDHQLDNAELTFAELTAVRHSMVRTLTGMLHTRIAYSGTTDKDKEKEKDEAASVKALPPPPPEEPSDSAGDAAPGGKA